MRGKIFLGALLFLMLDVAVSYAQIVEPCGGVDPDASCPLDTWVIILAAAALVFAAIHLYRRQTALHN